MTTYLKLFGEDRDPIDYTNINQEVLDDIAKSILNKHKIFVGDNEFRITEIEFYVLNDNHNDPYTHQDSDQLTFGKWYFHKTKKGNYRGGTFKGVDLTYGCENTYFGILVRAIYDESNDEFIEGPCNSVNKLLELSDCKDVNEYMETRKSPISARCTKNFYIKRCKGLEKHDVYAGPRIGLSDTYPDYRKKPYRYVIMKDRIKKQKRSLKLVE